MPTSCNGNQQISSATNITCNKYHLQQINSRSRKFSTYFFFFLFWNTAPTRSFANSQGHPQETEERPMANHLPVVELTDAELEMVSAGQYIAASNLVNVQLNNVLNNNKIAVDVVALNSGAFTQIQ